MKIRQSCDLQQLRSLEITELYPPYQCKVTKIVEQAKYDPHTG